MIVTSLLKNYKIILIGGMVLILALYIFSLKNEIANLKETIQTYKTEIHTCNTSVDLLSDTNKRNLNSFKEQEKEIEKLKKIIKDNENTCNNSKKKYILLINSLKKENLDKEKYIDKTVLKLKKCEVRISTVNSKIPKDETNFLKMLNDVGEIK